MYDLLLGARMRGTSVKSRVLAARGRQRPPRDRPETRDSPAGFWAASGRPLAAFGGLWRPLAASGRPLAAFGGFWLSLGRLWRPLGASDLSFLVLFLLPFSSEGRKEVGRPVLFPSLPPSFPFKGKEKGRTCPLSFSPSFLSRRREGGDGQSFLFFSILPFPSKEGGGDLSSLGLFLLPFSSNGRKGGLVPSPPVPPSLPLGALRQEAHELAGNIRGNSGHAAAARNPSEHSLCLSDTHTLFL